MTEDQAAESQTVDQGAQEGADQDQHGGAPVDQQGQDSQQDSPLDDQQSDKQPDQSLQPVEYGDFQAPEGVTLDQDALSEFTQIAGAQGLTQEQAQKVVDIGIKMQQKWSNDQAKAMQQARDQWEQSSRADQEFGGDGLESNLGLATKALDKFGTPALKQLLVDSGLGNHPEVIRLLYRTGKAISEDRFVGGGRGPGPAVDPAKVLFPTMK